MTKQTVNILSRKPAIVELLNAMAAVIPDHGDIAQVFKIDPKGDGTTATVEVFVNGVPVPFVECLQVSMDLIYQRLDEGIKAKALELIQEHPTLRSLHCAMEEAEWKIKDALDSLMKDRS